jgi:glycosyltransferase involved in cell wall biosynthesis
VHVVVPDSIDDPARPSGGNAYDRRVCDGLSALGWTVQMHAVAGSWPVPDLAALAGLTGELDRIPSGAVVLVDGLIGSAAPEVLVPIADRLRLVVLVHMPLGEDVANGEVPGDVGDARAREEAVLSAAVAVVTTSNWTRRRLVELYGLLPDRVHVAEPGVDAARAAPGTSTGGELLCVAAVTPQKGHDILLAALAAVADLSWRCVCVGSLDRAPAYADDLRQQAQESNIGDRVVFAGPLTVADLDVAYGSADVLVVASRAETYGMVVTEALARGLPVITTGVGGLPEALGAADGVRPGLLVPSEDAAALGAALRSWLDDDRLRQRLRHAARERRGTLPTWSATVVGVSSILTEVQA